MGWTSRQRWSPAKGTPRRWARWRTRNRWLGRSGGGGDGGGKDGDEGDPDENKEEQGSGADSEPWEDSYNEPDRYRKGSAAWHWDHRDHPLWEGYAGTCRLTSLQATFMLIDWRKQHKLQIAAIGKPFGRPAAAAGQALPALAAPSAQADWVRTCSSCLSTLCCKMYSAVSCHKTPGHPSIPIVLHPRSFDGVPRKLSPGCRAKELESTEWHLCANRCTAFAPVKRTAWRHHAEVSCAPQRQAVQGGQAPPGPAAPGSHTCGCGCVHGCAHATGFRGF